MLVAMTAVSDKNGAHRKQCDILLSIFVFHLVVRAANLNKVISPALHGRQAVCDLRSSGLHHRA